MLNFAPDESLWSLVGLAGREQVKLIIFSSNLALNLELKLATSNDNDNDNTKATCQVEKFKKSLIGSEERRGAVFLVFLSTRLNLQRRTSMPHNNNNNNLRPQINNQPPLASQVYFSHFRVYLNSARIPLGLAAVEAAVAATTAR